MLCAAACGDLLGAEQTFRALLATQKLAVDVISFNSLINIYVQHGKVCVRCSALRLAVVWCAAHHLTSIRSDFATKQNSWQTLSAFYGSY